MAGTDGQSRNIDDVYQCGCSEVVSRCSSEVQEGGDSAVEAGSDSKTVINPHKLFAGTAFHASRASHVCLGRPREKVSRMQYSADVALRCRRVAMQRWREGQTAAALTWAGRAGDTDMANAFATPLVQAIQQQLCSNSHSLPGMPSHTANLGAETCLRPPPPLPPTAHAIEQALRSSRQPEHALCLPIQMICRLGHD